MKIVDRWNQFFGLTEQAYPDEYDLLRARVTYVIIGIYIVCWAIYGCINLILSNAQLSFFVNFPTAMFLMATLLFQRRLMSYRIKAWIGSIATTVSLILSYHMTGNFYSPNSVWFYGVIIAGALKLGRSGVFRFVGIVCVCLILNYWLTHAGLQIPFPDHYLPLNPVFDRYILLTQIAGFVATGFAIFVFQSMLYKAYQTARVAKKALELKKMQLDEQNTLLAQQQGLLLEQKTQLEASHEVLKDLDQQKTHFFQNISHELRTPLTLILSSVRKMDATVPAVGVLQRNTERLYRLVNQLLDYQKLAVGAQNLHTNALQISSVINSIAETFGPACEDKNVRFVYRKLSNHEILVQAQIDAIEKIIYNFLSNALKFTPSGGMVELSCRCTEDDVRIEVRDTGPGISVDDKKKLFKVFSQVDGTSKREYEGTGLGLALAKELTEKMGGRIGVESVVGQGSIFWVSFPICLAAIPLDLLYVGDREFVQEIEVGFRGPNRHDWVIKEARTQQDAIQLLRSHKVHVLVVDTNWKDGDSVSVLAFAWQHQLLCHRVLLTDKIVRHDQVQKALTEGRIERVLSHPLSLDGVQALDTLIREARVNEREEVDDLLIVDDEVMQLRRFEKMLDDRDEVASLHLASTYNEALNLIQNRRLKCVVADARLGGDSGIALLNELARIQPNSFRVLITGDERPEIFDAAIREKTIHRILYKPIEPKEFCDQICAMLEQYQSKYMNLAELGKAKEWLLADARQAREPSPDRKPLDQAQSSLGTLLVADDIDDLRQMICSVLEQAGYSTLSAHDGRSAWSQIQATHPDLVITDWMMPGMTGPELIQSMQSEETLKSIPTILLTAKGDISRADGIQAGVSAYLSKPFDDAELLSTVHNLLRLKESERKVAQLNRHLTENILSRSFPPELVAAIQSGDMSFEREPKLQTVTILFVDLCDFSRTSINLGPRKVASMINQFFQVMTDVVFEHSGFVDKFTGDGMLCVFGAPKEMSPQHQVELAIRSSDVMQEKLAELNLSWQQSSEVNIAMRIGIHHGPVVIGMFGGTHRQEYTVIGPTVNLASRIQTAAQPGDIWFSETVRDYLEEESWESVGSHDLKGVGKVNLYRKLSPLRRAS